MLVRPDVVELKNQVLFTWDAEDGSKKWHHFDLFITKKDGSRVAIMVKYDEKLSSEEFQAKIADIASHVTDEFADRVTIMTEKISAPSIFTMRSSSKLFDGATLRWIWPCGMRSQTSSARRRSAIW